MSRRNLSGETDGHQSSGCNGGRRRTERLDRPTASDPTDALTADERVTLRIALETGFFDEPKATALVEAAADHDRSEIDLSHRTLQRIGDVLRESDISGCREA